MDGYALNLDSAKAWCERNNIPYLFSEALNQIAIPRGKDQRWMIRIIPRADRKMCTMVMPIPLKVPQDRYDVVREAITLANSTIFMGAWVLNSSKGEVYFRVTVPTEEVLYSDNSMRFLLQVIIGTVERMGEGLRKIVQEGADVSAIRQVAAAKPD
ncbi:MAG: hypothetical protein HN348_03180 [Proteobacteria bacterium]|jgi:hypothetical protein|nr:hypothetical protein [Pseudomonadota bacterium]